MPETATKHLLGLRTVIYHVPPADLAAAKAWYTELLGFGPYFDEPFYVGFSVAGYELGLHPDLSKVKPGGGTQAYWGVPDARAAHARMAALGAKALEEPQDVGGGILTATYEDPWGNVVGLIENPHFQAEG
jgi:predicted enzyme related to lactoylglutathione lyase